MTCIGAIGMGICISLAIALVKWIAWQEIQKDKARNNRK